MWYKLFLIFNIILCTQYKLDLGKVFNRDIQFNPYYYVKNENKLNILFWNFYNESSYNNIIIIKCKNQIKYVNRTTTDFYLDTFSFNFLNDNVFNLIRFDKKKLYYTFNYEEISLDFICDLKYLEFNYLGKEFKNGSFISNIQIYDTDETDMFWNFLKPLVFVDLRSENINSRKFNNKINLFSGGLNGHIDKKYSQVFSSYSENYGVDWIINQRTQFIELDDKIFSFINNKINKAFSIYINIDIINKFLDKNNIQSASRNIQLYQIINENTNSLLLNLSFRFIINNSSNSYILLIQESGQTLFYKTINYNDIINSKKQIDKEEIGIKFFMFTYYKNSKKKFTIGFKNDSNFKKDKIDEGYNDWLFEHYNNSISTINIKDSNANKLRHFIGNYHSTVSINIPNDKMILYFIINEYAIFSGGDLDEIVYVNNDINLKIKGRYNILINNNRNLDRRFNLNSNIKLSKCASFKCSICDINNICLFCFYNYYWNNINNCLLNTNLTKFVNDYSELIDILDTVKDHEFIKNNDFKNYSNSKFDDFKKDNIIIFLNLSIVSSWENNILNFQINNPIEFNYNTFFEKNIKSKPLTIFFKNSHTFNNYIFEIKNNTSFQLLIQKNIELINCDNLENQLIYKDMNCDNICTANLNNYYYTPVNYKKGKCLKEVMKGFYIDNNKNIIKCPFNCLNCEYITSNKKINCIECLKGYNITDGNCIFNNEFNCENDNDLNSIFDNKNKDNIVICEEFCNLCRLKKGKKCSILNLSFDFCNLNNIKILEPTLELLNENKEKCLKTLNNNCIKCKDRYYINDIFLCEECINNCLMCNNSYKCDVCEDDYYLNNDICNSCNSKFENCLKCNINTCLKTKIIKKEYKCDINYCKTCNGDNICINCIKGYKLNENICNCDLNNEYFLNNNNDCLSCNKCNMCKDNDIIECPNCNKCKHNFTFNLHQNKKNIDINYNNDIKILKINSLINITNIENYIVLFNKNNINIKIFDNKIIDSYLIINTRFVKSLKFGKFITQKIKLNNFLPPILNNFNSTEEVKIDEDNRHNINIIKYKFPKINFKNSLLSNSIEITNNYVNYSRFLIIFMPFIIFLNQTSLIILLNNEIDDNFLNLLKLIKKVNTPIIDNSVIFDYKDFSRAYNNIKIKFKDNWLIGEINLLDLDLPLIFGLLTIYYLLNYCTKNKIYKNSIVIFFLNKIIYIKVISYTLFQSYLIKNYYKIIFFTEVFFELKNYYLKLYLFFWIEIYLILVLGFWNIQYFYCNWYNDPYIVNFKDFKDYEVIKLFVYFKKKSTRNYNLIMNFIDFFIVLVFMQLSNIFIVQISILLLLILIKLLLLINYYFKYKKNKIFTQIISFILLFNFYILFLFIKYSIKINNISYLLISYFILLNIWEINRIFIYFIIKYTKKFKLKKLSNLKNKVTNINLNEIKIKYKNLITNITLFWKKKNTDKIKN